MNNSGVTRPLQEPLSGPEPSQEVKLLLLALASKGAFAQTRLLAEIREAIAAPEQTLTLLAEQTKRLTTGDWSYAERQLSLAARDGVRCLTLFCDAYPEVLRQIPDPPLLIFVRGQLPQEKMVAVVGARNASGPGLEMAKAVARVVVAHGYCVVSGLALGIDAAAHRGALEAHSEQLKTVPTVAILGSGVLRPQPRQNVSLAEKILALGGGLISEFGVDNNALKHFFPRRNRIIAGLSARCIVVEAAERSGSLITARLALEQGRDVAVVPGPPLSSQYVGSNTLLRDGAKLILNPHDVVDELPGIAAETLERPQNFAQQRIDLYKRRLVPCGFTPEQTVAAEQIIEHLARDVAGMDAERILHCTTLRDGPQLRLILSLLEVEGIVFYSQGRFRLGEMIDRP